MADSLVATFSYCGDIVDAQGKPVPNVEVTATHQWEGRGHGYINVVRSDAHGHFAIDRVRAISGEYAADVIDGTIRLAFQHPDHAFVKVVDLRTFTHHQATHLKITLPEGRSLVGQMVDQAGQPVAGAWVDIAFGDDYEQRRGTTTDADGRFTLRGLPREDGLLRALTVATAEPALTAQAAIESATSDVGTMTLTPIALPVGAVTHHLFGMKLVDVDDSLQTAFHLPRADGVLVLDPGTNSLGLDLQRGDQFSIVGDKPVRDYAEFTQRLLALSQSPELDTQGRVRVVYAFRRPTFAGTNTQYVALRSEDIAALSSQTGLQR